MAHPRAVAKWVGNLRSRAHSLMYLWALTLNLDVVCVQETHIDPAAHPTRPNSQASVEHALQTAAADLNLPPYTCFWAHGNGRQCGVGVLIRSALINERAPAGLKVGAVDSGGDGRRIAVPISWAGHRLTVLNVYLPVSSQRPKEYIDGTAMPWIRHADGGKRLILGI